MELASFFIFTLALLNTLTLRVPIANPTAKNIIQNSYIVVYNESCSDDEVVAHQAHWTVTMARRNIGKRSNIGDRFLSTTVKTFSIGTVRAMALDADDQSAIEINQADEVAFIESDTQMHIETLITQDDATTGLARLSASQPGGLNYSYDDSAGEGITVFVIDTGIMTNHTQFQGRATLGFNAVNDINTDENGHGSHVAGTIGGYTFGVAKKVSLVGVKVLDASGEGSYSGILSGIEYVVDTIKAGNLSGKAVVNMSLGGSKSQAINQAITAVRIAGAVPVVAAGNDHEDASNDSPASAPGAITVGAIDQTTDQRAWFSNFGQVVDVFAPGVNVESVGIQNTTATKTEDGTSMASPHVAGLAAYLMALHNITDVGVVEATILGLAGATNSSVMENAMLTTDLIANNGHL
ncbi:putative serine endopeptidase [Cryphonectria parasitica EP155]|uniref:Serine endopeptidase n=1 Tax=Cryphonectria parasitica (strain ATCC 38755 / EP155) TaxID=660469 RepID=A0A9P5CLS8_CRYP1|nr:putative serine endopeptidase [Cryphonectria parasitica EP155]KAF3762140.1 putative serine endopeptidase [Cryphonectria parasitica EP155]